MNDRWALYQIMIETYKYAELNLGMMEDYEQWMG